MAKLIALAYGGLCIWFLVEGYLTGRMRYVGSFALWGAADVRGNPAWFWGYGLFNTLGVALGVWGLIG